MNKDKDFILQLQAGQCVSCGIWADELIAVGADRVHVVESPLLSDFVEENYTEVLAGLVRKQHPSVLLIGATPCGRGLSARLAAVLHTGLTADCTELEMDTDSGLLRQIRPAFGGNLMATIVNPVFRPQMASVRPGVMKARQRDTSRRREIVYHAYEAGRADSRVRVLEAVAEEVGGTSLNDSSIIIT
uniref:electron transfer flavoprotein subunit alpha/FixB family protein n=1 Tax=Paraprevotella clara TaxID=454154 RepID=UPI003FF1256A